MQVWLRLRLRGSGLASPAPPRDAGWTGEMQWAWPFELGPPPSQCARQHTCAAAARPCPQPDQRAQLALEANTVHGHRCLPPKIEFERAAALLVGVAVVLQPLCSVVRGAEHLITWGQQARRTNEVNVYLRRRSCAPMAWVRVRRCAREVAPGLVAESAWQQGPDARACTWPPYHHAHANLCRERPPLQGQLVSAE